MKLYSSEQSKKIDQLAIQYFNLPEVFLIKKSGLASLKVIKKQFPNCEKITVFCGLGNNGADGLMLAQYAYLSGYQVEIIGFFEDQKNLPSHYQQILQELEKLNLKVHNFKALQKELTEKALLEKLNASDLIVDAIFGIGLDRKVGGVFKQAIELINASQSKVFSIDIASGLRANTGSILGDAIKADATLTFIVRKFGLYSADGVDASGKIFFNRLGIETIPLIETINQQKESSSEEKKQTISEIEPMVLAAKFSEVKKLIPKRKKNSHKNHFGTALLIGGNDHMAGAIALAALACLKVGVGLCHLVTRKQNAQMLPIIHPEIMGYQSKDLVHLLNQDKLSSIAIGPGLGKNRWGEKQFEIFYNHQSSNPTNPTNRIHPTPSVIDADGLNLLSEMTVKSNDWLKNSILTPHPKEAARLLAVKVADIQNNRIEAVQQLHQKYQSTIVLKGKGTLIYDGKTLNLCQYGNSGMACGGIGDALTGIIAGLLAQKIASEKAALIGTILHSYFGDRVAKTKKNSLTASDLIDSIQI